ncbi:MAG: sugar nucleotide-binding protein, partial [Bacteroidales bacterium]
DGNGPLPYKESERTDPQSVYGVTKLKGEEAIINSGVNYVIIRTSWLYSQCGSNFVKTIYDLSYEKPSLNVVFDQIGTPTYARDLAGAIIEICTQYLSLKKGAKFPFGIYHYSNEGVCSWYDFAHEIVSKSSSSCNVNAVTSDKFPTKAKRPPYSVMDKIKIKSTFRITIPHWSESLKKYFGDLDINN